MALSYCRINNMSNRPARGSIAGPRLPLDATAEVLGESRNLKVSNRALADDFQPYAVHLYRLGVGK